MPRTPTDGKPKPRRPRLFPAEAFEGFGPSRFRPADEPVTGRRLRAKKTARLLSGVRDHAPRMPGVYGMFDPRGKLVYVGKAKNLRCRLLSYFRENSRDPKAGKILRHTRVLVWEQTGDEFAALLRELELIQEKRPRFNVLGVPGLQRHHYLCLGKSPAPYIYAAAKPTGKERACYGPLVARTKSEDAARRLNDWYKLRDCPQTVPMAFADQADIFPVDRAARCLRFELTTCKGPCAGHCTVAEYGAGVRAAKAFLDGRDRSLLSEVHTRMEAASADYAFEKATAMRDRLKALEWLDARLALLRQARNRQSFAYPLTGADGVERWYLLHRGQVRGVVAVPATAADGERAAAIVTATFAEKAAGDVLSAGAVDSVLLVEAWFRKNPAERAKLMTKEVAGRRCVDCTPKASGAA